MNPIVVKVLFRSVVKHAARDGFVGRNRERGNPGKGRFTRSEIDDILKQVWALFDESARDIPQEPKLGNRLVMLLACLTLNCLEIIVRHGVERQYAIELIGDVCWNVYKRWGQILIPFVNLRSRDPRERMRMFVNLFLRFPFTPPGYRFERRSSTEGISVNMLRCPVAEYLGARQASDLCVGAWCNLDFALAEMWGGRLERNETLAGGCERCDFRFKADAR